MSGDDFGRIIYLGLILVAVGGWFFAESRRDLGRNARMALVWGLIFVGIVAAYGLWGDVRNDILPRQSAIADGVIEVPVGRDGHYRLTLTMNGQPVEFIVDTGASAVVLSRADANRIGLNPDSLRFGQTALTANGRVSTAPAIVATVELEGITDRDLPVSVSGGEMDMSLLGMTYLERFDEIAISSGKLVLRR